MNMNNNMNNDTFCVVEICNGVEKVIYEGSRIACNRIKSERKSRISSRDYWFHDCYIQNVESRRHCKSVAALYEAYKNEYPENKRIIEEKDGKMFDLTWLKYKEEHMK